MARLLLILKVFLLSILWLATALVASIYIERSEWEYPETGRYFDYDTGTTYDEGAVLVYGLLTILLLLLSVVFTFLFVRGRIRKRRRNMQKL